MANNEITKELLDKYFALTGEALQKVKDAEKDLDRVDEALDFLDLAERYYADAHHFFTQGDWVLAYGALYYAHAMLDAGARLGLFKVADSRLFIVDD